jgi:hypothetical protein
MSKEIMEILGPTLGEDLAKDILAHRKGLKCPLTARGAKGLLKQYEASGDAVKAAEYHLNMGWRGFDVAWLKGKNFSDPHNPSPRPETREEYLARAVQRNNEAWETSSDRRVSSLIRLAVAK